MSADAAVIDRLVNALQSALVLVERLAPDAQQHARDVAALHDAISRAATAAQELRPGGQL